MTDFSVRIEGQDELVRKLRAIAGPKLKSVAKTIVKARMAPVLAEAQATAPVQSGRLRASLGELASSLRSSTSAKVGTRRDFSYVSTSGDFKVSGRGKNRARLFQKGFTKDKTTAQQYARGIEFGVGKDGRVRRKAGPAEFLEGPITRQTESIINGVADDLRRYVETQP